MNDFLNLINTIPNRPNYLPINLSSSFHYDRKRRLISFRVINFGKNDFGILGKDVYWRERERKRKRFLRTVGNSRVEHGIHGIIRGLNIG